MDSTQLRLTVFFDEPFWVGVFERLDGDTLSVCKVTFGAEPKDYEVWEFVLKHFSKLHFSPAIEAKLRQTADNPKRRARNARKQMGTVGIGTKSNADSRSGKKSTGGIDCIGSAAERNRQLRVRQLCTC